MTQDYNHPITPPPELVQQWATSSPLNFDDENWGYELFIAHHAAEWGADQELEACFALIDQKGFLPSRLLRAARRPKPPSLKEQALGMLAKTEGPVMLGNPEYRLKESEVEIIRRALEALPND